MTWTIIAGEGARYRGQRRRVWSWVTPFGHVLWRDGSSVAWAPFRQSTEEYRAVWNGPKALFHFSVLLLCASEGSCQILLSFFGWQGETRHNYSYHLPCFRQLCCCYCCSLAAAEGTASLEWGFRPWKPRLCSLPKPGIVEKVPSWFT